MNVGGVTTNYPIGYEARRTQRAATEKTFARDSYTYCGTGHLRIGGMVSRALDKGANVTVYKSDSYTADNPILRIVTTSADGKENEQLIDPRTIDISNATQNEMLALNAYLAEQGKLDAGVPSSILTGADVTPTDLERASNVRTNFLDIAKEMMEMQYRAHNYSGYALYRKYLGVYSAFMQQ